MLAVRQEEKPSYLHFLLVQKIVVDFDLLLREEAPNYEFVLSC